MVDILLHIISDFTALTYVEAFEISISTLVLVILTWTLYCVRKYTKYAKDQTEELIKQRSLSMTPSLMHSIHIDTALQGSEEFFFVKNIGNGPAINIRIITAVGMKTAITPFSIEKLEISSLMPKDETRTCLKDALSGKIFDQNNLQKLKHQHKTQYDIEIIFRYQDIEGNQYEQKNILGTNGYSHGISKRKESKDNN